MKSSLPSNHVDAALVVERTEPRRALTLQRDTLRVVRVKSGLRAGVCDQSTLTAAP